LQNIISQLSVMGFFDLNKPKPDTKKPLSSQVKDGFFNLKSYKYPVSALWETTSKCNLACPYCFPDMKQKRHNVVGELSTKEMLHACDQLIESKVLRLTISGGEALLREDIGEIINKLAPYPITVAIITNGAHQIKDSLLEIIKKNNVFVAVSLDGPNEEINNITRGRSAFKRTVDTISRLKNIGIPCSGICTVTRHNFGVLENTVRVFHGLGIKSIVLQDLRPFGTKATYDAYRLSPEQENIVPAVLGKLEETFPDIGFNFNELLVFGNPLKPVKTRGLRMECLAGEHYVYIDVAGNVYPCTHFKEFSLGNLLTGNLTDMWRNCDKLLEFRHMKSTPRETISVCKTCERLKICKGACNSRELYYGKDENKELPIRCPQRLKMCEN
jgi:radical SAM protein with 4Fe4S-binding SPASM domain